MEIETDPLEGASSNDLGVAIRTEIKVEENEDENFSALALLDLARCVQINRQPLAFTSTDAMKDPRTGHMICLYCFQDFQELNLLSDHMVDAHKYRKVIFKCHKCSIICEDRDLIEIHRKTCRPDAKIKKRKTFEQVLRLIEMKCAAEWKNSSEPVPCPMCPMELPKSTLKEHITSDHWKKDEKFTCDTCNKDFKYKLTLGQHIKLVHEQVKPTVKCTLCGQKFRSMKYLGNHKRNVHPSGDKVHKCSTCDKVFKSHLCLHQHVKFVHAVESASEACPHCPNKVYKTKGSLAHHIKLRHKGKKQ